MLSRTLLSRTRDFGIRSATACLERGWAPEFAERSAIRMLLRRRLHSLVEGTEEDQTERLRQFQLATDQSPIALNVQEANQQHYEVPTDFFTLVLGPRKKYSCCLFPNGNETLVEAETGALEETAQRAGLEDGQEILELGCGWGSLTLWMAERYPRSQIVAVSNSRTQRDYIEKTAQQRNLHHNLKVLTCDVNSLDFDCTFDRVVSVEMFEHVRNHGELLRRIAGWLRDDGKLFVHIFAHARWAYPFETNAAADWMGRHFFSGGMMPNLHWFDRFGEHLRVEQRWTWNGRHYAQTSEHWLANLIRNRKAVIQLFNQTYGEGEGKLWFHRWRLFFLACAELFGYGAGQEWQIGHYRFAK